MEAASTSSGAGGFVVVLLLLGVLIGGTLAYNSFKLKGFRPRRIETRRSSRELRRAFAEKVAGYGWTVVDDGNPMIAQSGMLAGIRQQISLEVTESAGRSVATVMVTRYAKKVLGGPTKAYTPRRRMNAFLAYVQEPDDTASVAG